MAEVEVGLLWLQVYSVIQDVAGRFASSVPQRQVHSSMTEIFTAFGYQLWRALEETYPEQFGELIVSDEEAYWARKGGS